MSQTYLHQFPMFCRYTFVSCGPEDGDLHNFHVFLMPTSPIQQAIQVTHLLADDVYAKLYDAELTLCLEAHQAELAGVGV